MATLLIALPILSTTTLQAAGSQAGQEERGTGSTLNARHVGDPPADQQVKRMAYLERLAKKRLHLLGKRERRIVALLTKIHKMRASGKGGKRQAGRAPSTSSPAAIICRVFGSQCRKAQSVARCESGFNVYARNGQYWGLFQFGSFARAHYGFAWDAWTQTRAAYRYYRDAGWSPWTCA